MSYCFWIYSIFHGHGVQGNHVDSGEANSPCGFWRGKFPISFQMTGEKRDIMQKGRERLILLITYGAKKSHPFHPHPKVGDLFVKWDA